MLFCYYTVFEKNKNIFYLNVTPDSLIIQMTPYNIVGIVGFKSVGKDTVADYLVQHYGFVKLSYASALKDVVSIVFGWDRQMLEGDTPASRAWREQVDEYWNISPRQGLQKVGTDLFRQHLDPSIWIKCLHKKIVAILQSNPQARIVVTDCRFENEIRMIKEMQGTILHVRRFPEPDWLVECMSKYHQHHHFTREMFQSTQVHNSEWEHLLLKQTNPSLFDIDLLNKADVQSLYTLIDTVFCHLQLDRMNL